MTLPRLLEPEVMDTPQEAQEYDEMDHCEVNRVFVEDLLRAAQSVGVLVPGQAAGGPEGQADLVIDLGTGTAQIPVELCRQHVQCRVTAVDLSISMLEIARYNIEARGLTDRVQLQHIDAKEVGFSNECCDVVMSNSIVHHIPDPLDVLTQAARLVRQGGVLFFRDLLRPPDRRTLEHLVETYAGSESEFQQKMFADSLHAALTLEEMRDLVAKIGLSRQSVEATTDRHWTLFGVR